ncbi:WS/DGAT/MGAT family acyltransferase [Rhodococcus sp. AG1013]|uniref:wax ester/triacylglycerol synthase domain-containing protein n=1 Tax=Rhodococcus sp. AG1013 TaxID=2183996 RepID=UPI000E09FD37|nr:wax ester/triacylglycerol synthase domain-containing protein [Rhodococcus sp. AG1013]RDI35796.1 WS/DGAT/MGAT family acyltransferase [Rhodococcus sp. AG1013]
MTTTEREVGGITRLAPQDADFVYHEGENHISNSTGIYLFDTTGEAAPITQAEAIEWMRPRLGYSGVFTRRLRHIPLALDYPFWVPDPTLDLAQHVIVEPVDGPGWDALRHHIARFSGKSLDLTRPPWKLHFLTGVTGIDGLPDRMTVAVLRCHHSSGDGLAARDLALRIFGRSETHPPVPTTSVNWFTPAEFVKAIGRLPQQWRDFRQGLTTSGEAARRVTEQVEAGTIAPAPPRRPATRFNTAITPDLTFDVVSFPPEDIRAVQAAVEGVTFNDVLLATISGALAAYLAEKGETPPSSLSTLVPMSLRGTRPGVADHPDGNRANHLALMAVDLHTDIDDPVQRLRAINASVRAEKERHRNPDVQEAASRIDTSPAWLLKLVISLMGLRKQPEGTVETINTMVSNIPWTGNDMVLRGAPLVKSFGILGIIDKVGLRHLIVSHHGDEIEISFCTDTAMMPDTDRYKALLTESFRALVERATLPETEGPSSDSRKLSRNRPAIP